MCVSRIINRFQLQKLLVFDGIGVGWPSDIEINEQTQIKSSIKCDKILTEKHKRNAKSREGKRWLSNPLEKIQNTILRNAFRYFNNNVCVCAVAGPPPVSPLAAAATLSSYTHTPTRTLTHACKSNIGTMHHTLALFVQ